MPHLLIFGYGYSARHLTARLASQPDGDAWRVTGTTRSPEGATSEPDNGQASPHARLIPFHGTTASPAVTDALKTATHIFVTIPPGEMADPAIAQHASEIAAAPHLTWIGYCSTTGVYGDRDGAWVDETAAVNPQSDRSRKRVAAEQAWTTIGRDRGTPVQIFRLAGIYGPGRSPLDRIRSGKARSIDKPGQVFNRIHVHDIAGAVATGIRRPEIVGPINCADNEPAPPAIVNAYAAKLLGCPPPPVIPYAQADLSPMAQSFYAENKRVRNKRLTRHLGLSLTYPSYREGLQGILDGEA